MGSGLPVWVDMHAWSLALKKYPFYWYWAEKYPLFWQRRGACCCYKCTFSRCQGVDIGKRLLRPFLDKLRRPIRHIFLLSDPYFYKMHPIWRFHGCWPAKKYPNWWFQGGDQQKSAPIYHKSRSWPQVKFTPLSHPFWEQAWESNFSPRPRPGTIRFWNDMFTVAWENI